ncbi:MAG: class II aldolase/adducin family protein [Clostridia bacterium]|nr:class II aldolase/adducin family protein [Clostridia bacterium]
MLEHLKIKVCEAYKALNKNGYASEGFVSAIDRGDDLIVVPPAYEIADLTYEDMLVVDLVGNVIEGDGDVPSEVVAHAEIYSKFNKIESIAQTYFTYSTAFAQTGRDIPFYGAYHGARYYGDIPCILLADEDFMIEGDSDKNEFMREVGRTIAEQMQGFNFVEMPACLIESIGLVSFGTTPQEALRVAYTTEKVAKTAYVCEKLQPQIQPARPELLDLVFDGKNPK